MLLSKLRFAILILASIGLAHRGDANLRSAAALQNISGDQLSASNAQTNSITFPSGAAITVRMIDRVDSSRNKVGDTFHASLENPVVVNDTVVAAKGTDVFGKLVRVDKNGKIAGAGRLSLALTGIQIRSQLVPISTATFEVVGKGRGKQSAAVIGGGAAGGAAIGAAAGGGVGAAIGAAAGAEAGAFTQLVRGNRIRVPSETLLEFTIEQAADIPTATAVPAVTAVATPGPAPSAPSVATNAVDSTPETATAATDPADDTEPPSETAEPQAGDGLVFVSLFVRGSKTFAPGFSAQGAFSMGDDRVVLDAGGTAEFAFTVPPGETLTVAFGTPIGGFVNSVNTEISLNGVAIATLPGVANGIGVKSPVRTLVWHRAFGPGSYVLSFRSGGWGINFYGLWLSRPEFAGSAHRLGRTSTETHIPDPLGTRWDENQAGSSAIWTRRGTSNIFDANWENGVVTAVVTVWVQDSNLRMERRNSSDGNDCDYTGSFAPDWVTASGTFDCLRWVHGGHWSAKIERALPLKQPASMGNSGIHSVDFQNFDYSANCFKENGSTEIVRLSNGQQNTQNEEFWADKPVFGDLKGDGQEEAIVVLSCHPSGVSPNVVSSEVFVFEMSANGPKVLATLPSSSWGGHRLDSTRVSDQHLDVSYTEGECNACRDWIVTVRFRWNGTQFVQAGQTRKPYKPS